uniref:non-specific serine/threonine protein kinase n=1 Tax=Hirondellea gigas TaxID=1518452 RepID=A0A6A7G7B6_9CRUS
MRTIGKWIIGDTLGVGGFSKVKLGIDSETGQKAALKILIKNRFILQDTALRQVKAEIQAMSKIQHENVIRLLDYSFDAQYPKSDGTVVDVMLVVLELASGGEFFDFLSYTGRFPEPISREFFRQLIGGLEACHLNGVAHRDVKPENLLLDDQFRLKIADFGFSKVLSSDNDTMATECGTKGYMAPEILMHNHYTMKTDIFACGVVLFIMLAGFPPFQIATRSDWWFHKLLVGRHGLFWQAHSRTAQFSETAKDLIQRLLEPDPEKRITLTQIMKHPWYCQVSELTREQMVENLRARKLTVDGRKEAERRTRVVNLDDPVQRDIDFGSSVDEKLPSANPDLRMFTNREAIRDISRPSSQAPASPLGASTPIPPPKVYSKDEHIKSYTEFFSDRPAATIFHRIARLIRSMRTQDVVIKQKAYKIKATISDDAGTIQFLVRIFRHSSVDGVHHIVFSRRQGDPLQYRKLYTKISDELNDLSIPNPVPTKFEEEDDVPS